MGSLPVVRGTQNFTGATQQATPLLMKPFCFFWEGVVAGT